MEVVAAISSVAGILSLLGETLDKTRKLRDFFLDVSSASITVSNFLSTINWLLHVIDSIKRLVEKLPRNFCGFEVVDLEIQLEDYTEDVLRWLKSAKALRLTLTSGLKMWLERTRIGINIKTVEGMRKEADRHIQAFNLQLSLIGR